MPIKDLFLALIVVIIWGFNFVIIKWGLQGLTPLALAAYRFVFVLFPAIFFIKPPKVPWWQILLFGLTQSFGQFAFLFSAISLGMPAGLASVVLQCQALFTLFISSLVLKENFTRTQITGVLISLSGLLVIAWPLLFGMQNFSLIGFALTLVAAFCWSSGNVILRWIAKKHPQQNMLSVTIWASLPLPVLFAIASYLVDGTWEYVFSSRAFQLQTFACIGYLSIGASIVGYGLWNHLIQKHSAVKVAPFSILVPVVGLTSAYFALSEEPSALQLVGCAVLLAGLLVNLTSGKFMRYIKAR